ncbi:MAG: sensor domain-containing protein, partial [Microbacterium gubbeenense]
MTSIPAPTPRVHTPLRLLGAAAHLVFLGFYGTAVFTLLSILLATGLGLALVLGIGALFLLGFVYVLFGAAYLETARVEGLYGFGMPMLRARRSPKRGFSGFLHTVWLQFVDGGMWRAVAHLAIATVLGWIAFFLATAIVQAIAIAFSPLYASGGVVEMIGFTYSVAVAPAVGIVVAILSLAGLVGLAMLHGVLARVLIAPIREAQLAAAARDASTQRADAIRASDVERTRIERDLHDGVQPRLVSVGMTLGLAQQKIDTDPHAAKALVAEA